MFIFILIKIVLSYSNLNYDNNNKNNDIIIGHTGILLFGITTICETNKYSEAHL